MQKRGSFSKEMFSPVLFLFILMNKINLDVLARRIMRKEIVVFPFLDRAWDFGEEQILQRYDSKL